jgi:DNA-binding PadR family transcriptional regulator
MLDNELQASSRILELLNERPMPLEELAENLIEFYPPKRIIQERTRAVLRNLEEEGLVVAVRERGGKVTFHIPSKP